MARPPEQVGEQPRDSDQDTSTFSETVTGRGGEKLWTRLTESLKEGLRGFGAGFVGGFTGIEVALPLVVSVATATLLLPEASSSTELLSRITNNLTTMYKESLPSISTIATIFGLGGGLIGAEMMGGYRFVTGNRA